MRMWLANVVIAIQTVWQGMYVTLWYFFQTYKRKAFTQIFEYPGTPGAGQSRAIAGSIDSI